MGQLTELLQRAGSGDADARRELFAVAYQELRVLAHARLRGNQRPTLLDTTALVHESFARFVEAGRFEGADRGHFFAYAGNVMRSVIVDFARRRQSERRGGDAQHVTLDTLLEASLPAGEDEIVAIHEILQALEASDPRLVRIVEMRLFAGLSNEEIATSLELSERTVRRDFMRARLVIGEALGK